MLVLFYRDMDIYTAVCGMKTSGVSTSKTFLCLKKEKVLGRGNCFFNHPVQTSAFKKRNQTRNTLEDASFEESYLHNTSQNMQKM